MSNSALRLLIKTRYLPLLLTALCSKPSSQFEELFELNADKIMESLIGTDIYRARARLNRMPKIQRSYRPVKIKNVTQTTKKVENKPTTKKKEDVQISKKLISTESTSSVPPPFPTAQAANITEEAIKFNRIKIHLEHIFKQERTPMPNFDAKDDEFEHVTRRFEQLQSKHKDKTEMGEVKKKVLTRREIYFDRDSRPPSFQRAQKVRAFALMEQFIYDIRYKLPFVQVLRKKYINSRRYRIGYLFSLLRTVKEQQQWLYAMMVIYHNDWDAHTNFNWHIQMFESCVRYDLDVTDLIKYIKKVEYERKIRYDPDYYEGGEPADRDDHHDDDDHHEEGGQ